MEHEQHIPVPPTEHAEPQTQAAEVQVPGLSFSNTSESDQPATDHVSDPQVVSNEHYEPESEYQPPIEEYHPSVISDSQERAPEGQDAADAESNDEASAREDWEARGVKRKHDEDSFDEDEGRQKRPRIDGQENKQTIFIGNLPPDVTESMLTEIFSTCGKIKDIRLNRHRDTGKVKGYVFINFFLFYFPNPFFFCFAGLVLLNSKNPRTP